MNTYIHIGYPKNASTTLQMDVFPNIEGALYLGRKYDNKMPFVTSEIQESIYAISMNDSLAYDESVIKNKLEDSLEEIKGDRDKLIFSWEAFSHNIVDRGVMAGRLASIFPDAKISVVIRNQMDALQSMYAFLVMQRGENINVSYGRPSVRSYERWIADQEAFMPRSFLSTLNYYDFISTYQQLFGKDRVTVLFFEELVRSPETFFEKMAAYLDVDKINIPGHNSAPKRNARPTGRTLLYNKLRGQFPNVSLSSYVPDFIAYGWRKYLEGGPAQVAKDELPEDMRNRLQDYYRDGNNKLQSELGIDLASYGYVL